MLREILIIKRKSNIVLATLQWCSDETGPLSQTSSGFVPNTAKRLSRRASHVDTLVIAHNWGPISLSEVPLVDRRCGPAGSTRSSILVRGGKHVAYQYFCAPDICQPAMTSMLHIRSATASFRSQINCACMMAANQT